jgi:hypothetical protein
VFVNLVSGLIMNGRETPLTRDSMKRVSLDGAMTTAQEPIRHRLRPMNILGFIPDV